MRLELFPLESVGHFKFGDHIQCYTSLLKDFKCDDPDEFGYVHYEAPDESFFITVIELILYFVIKNFGLRV